MMSCIPPVPLGWACPPASFASTLSGYVISLTVPFFTAHTAT